MSPLLRNVLLALALLIIAGAAVLSQAKAHSYPCGPRAAVLANLKAKFGEEPVQTGISAGRMVELVVSPEGSWTLLFTIPTNGYSCVVADGTDWERIADAPLPGKGA